MNQCLFHGSADCPAVSELDTLDNQIAMRLKLQDECKEAGEIIESMIKKLDEALA